MTMAISLSHEIMTFLGGIPQYQIDSIPLIPIEEIIQGGKYGYKANI